MLPEFPVAHDAIQKIWNEAFFKALSGSDPLISEIEVRTQKEGRRAFIGDEEIQYKSAHVEHQWKPESGKGIPFAEFVARAKQLGAEMAKQQAAICFKVLSVPGPRNAVFEKKKTEGPFSFDDFLSSLEKMEIDFDAVGMPKWPTGYFDAETIASIRNNSGAWQMTDERNRRLADFVEEKKKEFNEREARRRLVD
jgi:hypothetical protein